MRKIIIFDYLRALSVLIVTYYHVIAYAANHNIFLGPIATHTEILDLPTRWSLLLGDFVNLGEIGVAMFFLLSGFLIVRSREGKSFDVFLKKRVVRILPISVVGVIVTYVALMSVNSLFFQVNWSISTDELWAIFTNSLLINDIVPSNIDNPVFETSVLMPTYWFLAVIMKFYILIAFFQSVTARVSLNIAVGLFCFVLFFCFYSANIPIGFKHCFSVLAFSAHHIIYVMIGCSLYSLFYGYVFESKNLPRTIELLNPLAILVMFVLSYKALIQYGGLPVPVDMLKNYSISLVCFVVSLFCCRYVTKSSVVVTFFSNISFSLYVIHYSIAAIFVFILGRYSYLREMPFVLYALVFLLTIGVGFLLYRLVEKPCSKLF